MKRIILRWLAEHLDAPGLANLPIASVHFVALAALLAVAIGLWRVRREGLNLRMALFAIAAAGFGALWIGNWVALAFRPERIIDNPMTLVIFLDGGFSSIGAYAGATLCMAAALRLRRAPLWPYADALAPGLLIAAPIARLGCLWSGCDFGKVAPTLPWAMRYPRGTAAFRYLDKIGMVGAYQRVGLPMHPFPLYEALPLFLAGVVLLARPHLLGRAPGMRASGCAVLYCALRGLAEGFRAESKPLLGHLTALQALCILGVLLFGLMWWRLKRADSSPPTQGQVE